MIYQVLLNFLTHFFADNKNPIYRKNYDELFLLEKFLENFRKWLSVDRFALNFDKTQAITFLKNQGQKNQLTDYTIEQIIV